MTTKDYLDFVLAERRSLREALTALRERYKKAPNPILARTIRMLEDELKVREKTES